MAGKLFRLCECGCGQPTPLAAQTKRKYGRVKGEPCRFVKGHNGQRKAFSYTVDPDTGCWIWDHVKDRHGYGHFSHVGAHRWSYELHVGPIPEGLSLDHLCRNPPCVNPDHLEPVTHRENVLRGVSPCAQHARQTHCKRGHPLSGDNLRLRPNGHRACRECESANRRQRRAIARARARVAVAEEQMPCRAGWRHWFTVYDAVGLRAPTCQRCGAPNPTPLTADEQEQYDDYRSAAPLLEAA